MRAAFALAMVAALAAAPLALRPATPRAAPAATLLVITTHDENTRAEFAAAFRRWCRAERGVEVDIEWLTPGGTADIQRLLHERFRGAVAEDPAAAGDLDGFDDPHADGAGRRAFLAGAASSGIDLWWGGNAPAYIAAAARGWLVDGGLARERPTWFTDDVMPATLGGETLRDADGRWYGACLAGLGIAWNPERLALLSDPTPPRAWSDLGEPRWRDLLVVADPSRSAAAAAACERMIQQQMALAAAAGADEDAARAVGWERGLALIARIVANARAVEDAVSKPPRAVARGEAAAAICLDFQARGEAEYAGGGRLAYVAPAGGATLGAEPIALLRGAPHRALAVDFLRFVLSPDGQRLWDYRVGAPGGPERWPLRRAPIRRDVYTPRDRARMSDPELDPFALAAASTWRAERTAGVARLIGPLVRATMLDAAPELRTAWRAFAAPPVAWSDAPAALAALDGAAQGALPLQRAWTQAAVARWREAARLARAPAP